MSLVLLMVYWVFLPFLVFRAARWLFRRAGSRIGKGLVVAATVGLSTWFLWIAVGENMYWDAKVREMCAKDGGVKVYETVKLTPELLDQYGRIWIHDKSEAKSSDPYYYEDEEHYYRKGNPQITRRQSRIIRRSDGKVLGEYIRYSRGGGGLYGPWHGSSFRCPDPMTNPSNFESSIFVKGGK